MTIKFPTNDNPIRDMFDAASVAMMLLPEKRMSLPTLRDALRIGRESISADSAISSVNVVCIKANGDIVLEKIGKRGGHDTIWTFGNL